jgi:hypothetical protein
LSASLLTSEHSWTNLTEDFIPPPRTPADGMHSQLDMAQQEQDKQEDQDQPDQAAATGEDVVAAALAVAAAQQDENQDHDERQYDGTHGLLL